MRVLHINAGNLYGGVETLLVTLARFRVLCPGMDPSFALCFDKTSETGTDRCRGTRASLRRGEDKLLLDRAARPTGVTAVVERPRL